MEDSSERPAGVVRQSYGMHERARSVHLERCRRPVIGQAYSVETATGSQLGVAMIKIHVWSTTDGSKLATLEGFSGWVRIIAISARRL